MAATLIILAVIFVGGLVLMGIYFMGIYNNLVRLKHAVDQAWSNIEVILAQRHDEIPDIVAVAKKYAAHEVAIYEQLSTARMAAVGARKSGDVAGVNAAEGLLEMGLGKLFALSESNPELKSDTHFAQLSTRISELAETISDRREFYNEGVTNNNVRIEQFPDVLIARNFGFDARDLLEFTVEQTAKHDVAALLD